MFQQFQLFPNVFVLRICHCFDCVMGVGHKRDGGARGRARVQRLQKQGFGYQIAAAVIDIVRAARELLSKNSRQLTLKCEISSEF